MLNTFRDLCSYLSTPNGTPLSSRPDPANAPEHEYYTELARLCLALIGREGINETHAREVAAQYAELRDTIRTNPAAYRILDGLHDYSENCAAQSTLHECGLSPTEVAVFCLAMKMNAWNAFSRIPARLAGASLGDHESVTVHQLMSSAIDELGNGTSTMPHSIMLGDSIQAIGEALQLLPRELDHCIHLFYLKREMPCEDYDTLLRELLAGEKMLDEKGIPTANHSWIPMPREREQTHINPDLSIAAAIRLLELAEPFMDSWQTFNEKLVHYAQNTQHRAAYYARVRADAYPPLIADIVNAWREAQAEMRDNCRRVTHIHALRRLRETIQDLLNDTDTRGLHHGAVHNDKLYAENRSADSVEADHTQNAIELALRNLGDLAYYNPASALATLETAVDLMRTYDEFWASAASSMEQAHTGERPLRTDAGEHRNRAAANDVGRAHRDSVMKFITRRGYTNNDLENTTPLTPPSGGSPFATSGFTLH